MSIKVCDICGSPFKRGLCMHKYFNGIIPWKKSIYVCEKCENVIKRMVLQYRKRREV